MEFQHIGCIESVQMPRIFHYILYTDRMPHPESSSEFQADHIHLPVEHWVLVLPREGMVMDPDRTLKSYHVENGDKLILM